MKISSATPFGTPAIELSTAVSAGSSGEALRTDDTIIAFDTTVPTSIDFGDAASAGNVDLAARRNHLHGFAFRFAVLKKSLDTARKDTTTFEVDPHFTLAVLANETWLIEYRLKLSGVATGGIKWQFALPTGASVSWYYRCWTSSQTVASSFGGNAMVTGDANLSTGAAAKSIAGAIIIARVSVGGSNGNVIPQWAQETSDSTDTIIEAESYQVALRE